MLEAAYRVFNVRDVASGHPIQGVLSKRVRRPYLMFDQGRGVPGQDTSAGRPRVFLQGGSTVAEGTVARALEEELRRRGLPEARVYNAGIVSAGSGQSLVQLVFDIAPLEPDIVVQYEGGNDVNHPFLADPRPGYPYDFLVDEANPLRKRPRDYPFADVALFGSAVVRRHLPDAFLQRVLRLETLRDRVSYGSDGWRRKIAEIYVSNVKTSRRVAEAFGADYAAFFQPMLFYTDPVDPARLSEEDTKHALAVREALRELLRRPENRGALIDLSDSLDGSGPAVYTDRIHMRKPYYETMGRLICDHIIGAARRRAAQGG